MFKLISGWINKKKEMRINSIWDSKADEQIIESYNDNQEWKRAFEFLGLDIDKEMTKTNKMRFSKHIEPQMTKRNLWNQVK